MVPFGWPPTLLLSVKVFDIVGSAPELIVENSAEDIPVDVEPIPAVIEDSLVNDDSNCSELDLGRTVILFSFHR